MRKLFAISLLLGIIAPFASAQSITTLFASNNAGNAGGSVFFDATVASSDLMITSFDTNTSVLVSFGFSVYVHPGTYVGFETSPTFWTLVATGTGAGAGQDSPSPVSLDNTFILSANQS